jgi:CRP/FNR family transcriptional regulator, cyclic AMP receptor protein
MRLEKLKKCSLFAGMNNTELARLAGLFQELSVGEGSTVFVEQMSGESLFLIEEGTIKISKMLAEGEEQTLVVLGPEDVFGEIAIFDGAPRSITARVTETAKLLALKKSVFDQFCDADPRLGMKLMRNIVRLFSQRVRDNSDEYRQMLLWSLGRKSISG